MNLKFYVYRVITNVSSFVLLVVNALNVLTKKKKIFIVKYYDKFLHSRNSREIYLIFFKIFNKTSKKTVIPFFLSRNFINYILQESMKCNKKTRIRTQPHIYTLRCLSKYFQPLKRYFTKLLSFKQFGIGKLWSVSYHIFCLYVFMYWPKHLKQNLTLKLLFFRNTGGFRYSKV